MAFQKDIVYSSPKPRQIRMELNDLKPLKSASNAVESDAINSELSFLLLTTRRSDERGSYFKRPRGIVKFLLMSVVHYYKRL